MGKLTIELFGGVSIKQDGKLITGFKSRKAEAMLAYLVCHQRPFPRETLAYLFWGDSEAAQALANLRKTLTDLRKYLGAYLLINRQSIAFDPESDYWLDVAAFQQNLHQEPTTTALKNAVSLYKGDFLQGFYLRDSYEFDEWASLKREQYRLNAVRALQDLVTHQLHHQQYEAGITYATQWLALDPLNEMAYRQLMHLQARSGRRNDALAQYVKCQQVLDRELGVVPTAPTTALFERIRQAPERPFNFPIIVTSFIGREKTLAQISRYLNDPTCRLLTLKGPGGVGKTRLALQAAAHHTSDYLHGIYFISVASVDTGTALIPTIADALQFSLAGGTPPAQQLIDFMRSKNMLLLLDNCETLFMPHMADCLPFIRDIIQQAAQVKIIATSRERFDFQAERVLLVSGLSYDTDEAVGSTAVQLFVERARQVQPQFAPSAATLAQICQICQLAEGLPLAIELAAAAVAHYPLAQIITSIQQNLDFLGQQRDLPDRHRSLRAVFESAWARLTPSEQETFKKLSVFRGHFDSQTAAAITQSSPTTLLALVDKSILRLTQSGRYELHQLLRHYAAEKLTSEEKTAVSQAHMHYYATFLHQHETAFASGRQKEILNAINVEIENIRAAWQWAMTHWPQQPDITAVVKKSFASLHHFYEIRSWFQEGHTSFAQAIQTLETLDEKEELLLAQLRARYGAFCFRLGDYETAAAVLLKSIDIFRQHEADSECALTLNALGHAFHYLRQKYKAQSYYEESLALYRQIDDDRGIASALNSLGVALRMRGKYEEAHTALQEGLTISQGLNDQWSQAMILNNLGVLARMQGHYEASKTYYEESLAIKREIQDQRGIAISLNNLGNVAHILQQLTEAQTYHEESLSICETIGDRLGIARSFNNLGMVAHAQERYAKARHWYQKSLQLKQEIGDQTGMLHTFFRLGQTLTAMEALSEARTYFWQGLQLAVEMRILPLALDILVGWSDLLIKEGQPEEAFRLLAFASQHPRSTRATQDEAGALIDGLTAQLSPTAVTTLQQQAATQTLEEIAHQLLG